MIARRGLLAALVALGVGGPVASAPSGAPVVVFAAASLKNAMDDVARAYSGATGARIDVSYGASSALERQIEQGAPAQVFVSADSDWMDALQKKGLIVGSSRRDLLANHLALIAPADLKVRLTIRPGFPVAGALGSGGRLALAGQDVPAGRYGEASLKALSVWGTVEGRLLRAENVRAALAYVARGEAPLGIVYDTDAKVEPKVRIVGLFPDASHPRIVYPAALVKGATPPAAAFLKFLAGPRAAAIFRRYGFRAAT